MTKEEITKYIKTVAKTLAEKSEKIGELDSRWDGFYIGISVPSKETDDIGVNVTFSIPTSDYSGTDVGSACVVEHETEDCKTYNYVEAVRLMLRGNTMKRQSSCITVKIKDGGHVTGSEYPINLRVDDILANDWVIA